MIEVQIRLDKNIRDHWSTYVFQDESQQVTNLISSAISGYSPQSENPTQPSSRWQAEEPKCQAEPPDRRRPARKRPHADLKVNIWGVKNLYIDYHYIITIISRYFGEHFDHYI